MLYSGSLVATSSQKHCSVWSEIAIGLLYFALRSASGSSKTPRPHLEWLDCPCPREDRDKGPQSKTSMQCHAVSGAIGVRVTKKEKKIEYDGPLRMI
jgi:hypothetical protein